MAIVLPVALPDTRTARLSALFDAHHDRLYARAWRLAPSVDDALDLVQGISQGRALPEVDSSRMAGEEAWLVRVLINVRRDQRRPRPPTARCRSRDGSGWTTVRKPR